MGFRLEKEISGVSGGTHRDTTRSIHEVTYRGKKTEGHFEIQTKLIRRLGPVAVYRGQKINRKLRASKRGSLRSCIGENKPIIPAH